MQWVLTKIAWLMQLTLGTTATESLNAAACIFLGQVCITALKLAEISFFRVKHRL